MTDDIPEDVAQYARENGLQFDTQALRSPIVQQVLRLRMQHPEWKRRGEQLTREERQRRDWLHWQE